MVPVRSVMSLCAVCMSFSLSALCHTTLYKLCRIKKHLDLGKERLSSKGPLQQGEELLQKKAQTCEILEYLKD